MRDEDEITDCIVHSAQTEYKISRDLYFDEYKKILTIITTLIETLSRERTYLSIVEIIFLGTLRWNYGIQWKISKIFNQMKFVHLTLSENSKKTINRNV